MGPAVYRVKCARKTCKSRKCAAISVVSDKIRHPLSYQGCLNHRILHPLDVPVGGDRRLASIFDPAETT
jgi:hypothetical protein